MAKNVADICIGYSNTAVLQYQEAVQRKCGFSGPRWSNNTPHHYNWCIRGNNHKRANVENQRRAQELQQCKAKAKGPGSVADQCIKYANVAVQQYQEAKNRKCGFTGPRWSNNTPHHYNWCIRGNNHKRANFENQRRAQEVQQCKAKAKGPGSGSIADTCTNYANVAVQQYQQAKNRNCGFTGPRWSNSTPHHFNWCIRGNNHKIAVAQNQRRAQELASCK